MRIMAEPLKREKEVFDSQVENWRTEHLGTWVLIKDGEVIGFYPTLQKASAEGLARFGLQDFYIQQIRPSETINITFLGQRF